LYHVKMNLCAVPKGGGCSLLHERFACIGGLRLFLRRFLILHISRMRVVFVKPHSLPRRFVYGCNLHLYAFLQLLVYVWWCVKKSRWCSCSIL
jgi:hypothetical protein